MKEMKHFKEELSLLRQPRLSVVPVPDPIWNQICSLGGTTVMVLNHTLNLHCNPNLACDSAQSEEEQRRLVEGFVSEHSDTHQQLQHGDGASKEVAWIDVKALWRLKPSL